MPIYPKKPEGMPPPGASHAPEPNWGAPAQADPRIQAMEDLKRQYAELEAGLPGAMPQRTPSVTPEQMSLALSRIEAGANMPYPALPPAQQMPLGDRTAHAFASMNPGYFQGVTLPHMQMNSPYLRPITEYSHALDARDAEMQAGKQLFDAYQQAQTHDAYQRQVDIQGRASMINEAQAKLSLAQAGYTLDQAIIGEEEVAIAWPSIMGSLVALDEQLSPIIDKMKTGRMDQQKLGAWMEAQINAGRQIADQVDEGILSPRQAAPMLRQILGAMDQAWVGRPDRGVTGNQQMRDEKILRDLWFKDKVVTDFASVIMPNADIIRAAVEDYRETGHGAVNMEAAITAFKKILDPGSVVRESEYQRTPEDMAIINRLRGKLGQAQFGGPGLTIFEMDKLYDFANEVLYNRGIYLGKHAAWLRGQAAYHNLPPENIVPAYWDDYLTLPSARHDNAIIGGAAGKDALVQALVADGTVVDDNSTPPPKRTAPEATAAPEQDWDNPIGDAINYFFGGNAKPPPPDDEFIDLTQED